MKKLLVVLLTLALCVTTLASCDFINNLFGFEAEPEVAYNVDAAADYVYNLYKNKSVTAADFEVTAVATIAGVQHTVEWSVDTDKVKIEKKNDTTYIVNVDEESAEELAYVLTATIKGGDKTATKSFNLTVPKYVLWSHDEYMAAKEGDNVVIKGIVVAINSKAAGNTRNRLFLADTKVVGGYYSYQMDQDPVADLGIEIGMTVEITGPVAPYSGMQEIKGGTARIVDTNKKTVEVLDITDKILAGESIAQYVGLPVTMKGVEIAGQELDKDTSQYLNFKVGETTAYVRTYVTDFPTTLAADKKAEIDEAHAAHFGWKANATGILVLYSGNPYLIPMGTDCFEYLELIVKTDAEKVADVLENVNIATSFSADATVELPASVYPEVTLTWASDNDAIVIADGKMTVVVPEGTVTATVTATAVCGEVTETKTFEVKLSKKASLVKEIIDIALGQEHNVYTESKYLVAGIITEVYNTTYGNMKITDEFGNILTIYGTYGADGANRYDALENKPVAGDYVVILGIVGQYNGTPQIKNGWIQSYTTPTSVADAIAIGAAQGTDYTEEKYVVTGVITEVYNTQYGNMYITDGNGNTLTIYGTYSADGATRYDAMSVKPVAGDTVTIYGSLGQYKGTAQIKNGWIVAHEAAAPEAPEETTPEETTPSTPEESTPAPSLPETPAESTLTVEAAIALGASKEHNTYTSEKYYVTGVITEVYNTQYGNMKIKDEAGNILTIYGTYSADGTTRYDALTVKPVAGDTVIVYGIVGQYNGTPQIKNGWIIYPNTMPEAPETSEPEGDAPSTPAEGKVTYTFANYAAGEQYAANEVHKLDNMVTVTTNDAHFTKQIRLYQQAENNYGPARNGTAIFETASAIKSLSINAGEKKVPIEVYGSTNGTDWVLITTITVETTEYVDFEITLGSTEYTYIKLAAIAGQARVASVTFEF